MICITTKIFLPLRKLQNQEGNEKEIKILNLILTSNGNNNRMNFQLRSTKRKNYFFFVGKLNQVKFMKKLLLVKLKQVFF